MKQKFLNDERFYRKMVIRIIDIAATSTLNQEKLSFMKNGQKILVYRKLLPATMTALKTAVFLIKRGKPTKCFKYKEEIIQTGFLKLIAKKNKGGW